MEPGHDARPTATGSPAEGEPPAEALDTAATPGGEPLAAPDGELAADLSTAEEPPPENGQAPDEEASEEQGPDGAGDAEDDVDAAEAPAPDPAAEELVKRLLDNAPAMITVLNEDISWRYSNASAERLLGPLPDDLDPELGVLSLLHDDDVPLVLQLLERIRAGELPPDETFEVRVRTSGGDWRYLENTAVNLIDDPVVHGIVVRSTDVTDARQATLRLREANERLSTLIGSLHIAALVEDTDRVIVLTNEAFVDLFELSVTPGRLAGRTLTELGAELTRRFGDPTRVPGPDRVARILRERRHVIGDRIAMLDGRVLERDYVPIFVDHEYRGHLWLFRDVSAQARNEAEWTQLLATQREENERLVELDRVKASFLAEVSHELRTPLTSILSFTELLREGIGRDEAAEQEEFLDVIARNAERLLRLVDDLVLLDRAETGILPVEWGIFDLPAVVQAAATTFAHQAEAKQIELESTLDTGPAVYGDAHRVAQLLDVVLSNAVKFTPEGGHVAVTATSTEDTWFVSVADSGIGVPVGEREALFERFYRASNARAARIPGSGLGLSVARAIARMHGGEVSISGEVEGGTIVHIVLPVGSHPDLAPEPEFGSDDGDGGSERDAELEAFLLDELGLDLSEPEPVSTEGGQTEAVGDEEPLPDAGADA